MSTPVLDRETTLQGELERIPRCEGYGHATGLCEHVPEQAASYLVRMPCGYTYPCCAGRVKRYKRRQAEPDKSTVACPGCGSSHDVQGVTWTDLP